MVDIKLNTEDLLRLLFVRMDGKCYTIAAEQSAIEVAERVPFEAKWHLLARVEVSCYILISNVSGAVKSSPAANSSVSSGAAAQVSGRRKSSICSSRTSPKSPKCRTSFVGFDTRKACGRDVADYAGIDRSTYVHYEEYGKDLYPLEHMERIAQLFEVPVESLLDDYNLFL